MNVQFSSLFRDMVKICWAAGLVGIICAGQPSSAYGNPVPMVRGKGGLPASQSPEIIQSGRIVYIGARQAELMNLSDVAPLAVSRAVDLEGRPLALIVRPGPQPQLNGGNFWAGSAGRSLFLSASNRRITSGYGLRWDPLGVGWRSHAGVDLAVAYGSPVVASGNGTVSAARWQGGYGLLVALDHGGGVQTRYGHLSRLSVQEGQVVAKGDVIGYVGSTGRSTGPHLHYELREQGRPINPVGNTPN